MQFFDFTNFFNYLQKDGRLRLLGTSKLTLKEISRLIGRDIPHEMNPNFDKHPEKYKNDPNYQRLIFWRGLHDFCYRSIDGFENSDADEEWLSITALAVNKSNAWVDGFLELLIKISDEKLKVRLKNITTLIYLNQSVRLTAQDLDLINTDGSIEFNSNYVEDLAKDAKKIGLTAYNALFELMMLHILDLKVLKTLNTEEIISLDQQWFADTLSCIKNNAILANALKFPVLIQKNSRLPENLRPFEKLIQEDGVDRVSFKEVFWLIHILDKGKKLNDVIDLIGQDKLSLDIVYRQYKILKNTDDERDITSLIQWLDKWKLICNKADEKMAEMNDEGDVMGQSPNAIQSLVTTGFPLPFQRKAELKYWLKNAMENGDCSNIHLDFSAEKIVLDEYFWDYFLNECLPTFPKSLLTLDFRGQDIPKKHFWRLVTQLEKFPNIDIVHVSENFQMHRKDFENNVSDKSIHYKILREKSDTLACNYKPEKPIGAESPSLTKIERDNQEKINNAILSGFKFNEQGERIFEFSPTQELAKNFPWSEKKFALLYSVLRQNNPVITELTMGSLKANDAPLMLNNEAFEELMQCLPFLIGLKVLRINQSPLSEENKQSLKKYIPLCSSLERIAFNYNNSSERDFFLSNENTEFSKITLLLKKRETGIHKSFHKKTREEKKAYVKAEIKAEKQSFQIWLRNVDAKKLRAKENKNTAFFLDFTEQKFDIKTDERYQRIKEKLNTLKEDTSVENSTTIVTKLQCMFSLFDKTRFNAFMKNFVTQFQMVTEIDIYLLDSLEETEQEMFIAKLSDMHKLRYVHLHASEYSDNIMQKLIALATTKNIAIQAGEHAHEKFIINLGNDVFLPASENNNRNSARSDTSFESAASDLPESLDKKPAVAESQEPKILTELAFKKEPVLIENEIFTSLIDTADKTYAQFSNRQDTRGDLLYPWVRDKSFSSQKSQIILNGLLKTLGSYDESAEDRISFYYQFGLLPALIDFIEKGFDNKTLTWASIKVLDTMNTFENDPVYFYTPKKDEDIPENSENMPKRLMQSVPRQLPRLLAGYQRDRELSVDERARFDLYDNDPRHNPTMKRQKDFREIGTKKYNNFNNHFFDHVLMPVAKQRVLLFQALQKLEMKIPRDESDTKEMDILKEKIDMLSGFIKLQSVALKRHELLAAAAYLGGDYQVKKFKRESMPLFQKSWYDDKSIFISSDPTYRKEMAGTVTVKDLTKNNANMIKKDTSNTSRHYAKDLFRKVLGAFLVLATFPISLPLLCFSEKAYGTLFQTKTKSTLSLAIKKSEKLMERTQDTYWRM